MNQNKHQLEDFYDDNNSSSTNSFSLSKLEYTLGGGSSGKNTNSSYPMDPLNDNSSSTAVPIPGVRNTANLSDFTGFFDIDIDQSQSPISVQENDLIGGDGGIPYGLQPSTSNANTMWGGTGDLMMGINIGSGGYHHKQELLCIDDDDIFTVDKNDLYRGPTLSELNNDGNDLDDLIIDEYILPEDNANSLMLGMGASTVTTLTLLQPVNPSNFSLQQQVHMHQHHQQQQHQQQLQGQQQQQQLNQIEQNQFQNQPQMQMLQATHLLGINIGSGGSDALYDDQEQISPGNYHPNTTPTKQLMSSKDALSPQSQTSSNSSYLVNSSVSPPSQGSSSGSRLSHHPNSLHQHRLPNSTLQFLLKKDSSMSPDRGRSSGSQLGQSVPGPSSSLMAAHHEAYSNRRLQQFSQQHQNTHPQQQLLQQQQSRLSSSAPTNSSALWESHQMWQRREPRQHLLSTSSMAEAGSTSSLSTGGILSPEAPEFSQDEGYDDSDSDHSDYTTDNGEFFFKFYFILLVYFSCRF